MFQRSSFDVEFRFLIITFNGELVNNNVVNDVVSIRLILLWLLF